MLFCKKNKKNWQYKKILLACYLYTWSEEFFAQYSFNAECFDRGPFCLPGCSSSVCLLCVKHCTIHAPHRRCVWNQHEDHWASSFHGICVFELQPNVGDEYQTGIINLPIFFLSRNSALCGGKWLHTSHFDKEFHRFHCSCVDIQHSKESVLFTTEYFTSSTM